MRCALAVASRRRWRRSPKRRPQPPEAPPQHTNRLAKETSPYLLLHAHNPVDWYPWGEEALAKAKGEKKLIFLSIGYSSCYWCHVMERESFMDEEIAAKLNKNFVCIKVDREERPDIDEIYMQALHVYLQLVGSKQGGGWPLSMFLTPDAKPLMGGTYFPPRDKDGRMGFLTVLDRVHEAWTAEPREVAEDGRLAGRLRGRKPAAAADAARSSSSTAALVDAVLRALVGAVRRRVRRLWLRSGESQAAEVSRAAEPAVPARLRAPRQERRGQQDARARRSKRSRRAAFAITSAAAFIATAPTASGACRTSKKCSTTTASWSPSTRRPTSWHRATISTRRRRDARVRAARDDRRRRAASTRRSTPRPMPKRAATTSGTASEVEQALAPDEFALWADVYGIAGEPNFEGRYIPLLARPLAEAAKSAKLDRRRRSTRSCSRSARSCSTCARSGRGR